MSEGGTNASKRLCAVPGTRVGSCVPQLTTAIGVRCQSEGGGQHQHQVQLKALHQCFLDWGSFLKAFSPNQKTKKYNIVVDFWWTPIGECLLKVSNLLNHWDSYRKLSHGGFNFTSEGCRSCHAYVRQYNWQNYQRILLIKSDWLMFVIPSCPTPKASSSSSGMSSVNDSPTTAWSPSSPSTWSRSCTWLRTRPPWSTTPSPCSATSPPSLAPSLLTPYLASSRQLSTSRSYTCSAICSRPWLQCPLSTCHPCEYLLILRMNVATNFEIVW